MVEKKEPEEKETGRERIATGASATHSNVGPQHAGIPEYEEMDAVEGSTSGRQGRPGERNVHGKPHRGSRGSGDI